MIDPNAQSGIVLMAVLVMLLLIPAAVVLLQQRTAGISMNFATSSQRVELDYLLDAAVSHARYLADTNDSCANFNNMPQTKFGGHSYQGLIVQDPNLPRRLYLDVTATLNDGSTRKRLVAHTAYQPEVVGSLSAVADLSADSANPTDNFGSDDHVTVGKNAGSLSYGLFRYDLPGVIPPETKIVSAQLKLHVNSLAPVAATTNTGWLSVHAIGRDFTESASWNYRDGNKHWRPAGGTEPIHSDTAIDIFTGIPALTITMDITPAVKRWARDLDSFYGLLLKTSANVTLNVTSRNSSSFADRPALEITYSCPCGIACLIFPRRKYLDLINATVDPNTTARTCQADDDYRGSDGDIRWSFQPWQEIGDDGDPCNGELSVAQDPLVLVPDSYQLKFTGHQKTLQREAWLLNAEEVVVSFKYRRAGTTSTNQRLVLKASDGGGLQTLTTIDGGATDSEYQEFSFEVPASVVGPSSLFALYSENLNDSQSFYVDDFTISFIGDVNPPLMLPVVADSFLDQDKPDDKFVTTNPIKLKEKAPDSRRVVAMVDTAGLYDGEIISYAKLKVWVEDNRTEQASTLSLYAITESWHAGEVTWNDREKNVLAWTVPGGSYSIPANPADTPTVVLETDEKNVWAEFDIAPFIQSWADFPATNLGLILIIDDGGQGKEIKLTSTEGDDSALRPHVELQ